MPLFGPEGRKQLKAMGYVGTAGIELAVSTMVGFFGGMWLDGVLDTEPLLRWVGFGVGLVAGFRNLFRVFRKVQQQLTAEDDDTGRTETDDDTDESR